MFSHRAGKFISIAPEAASPVFELAAPANETLSQEHLDNLLKAISEAMDASATTRTKRTTPAEGEGGGGGEPANSTGLRRDAAGEWNSSALASVQSDPAANQASRTVEYLVTALTGWKTRRSAGGESDDAGTRAAVYVRLLGDQSSSQPVLLNGVKNKKRATLKAINPGENTQISVLVPEIGNLRSLR